MRRETRRIEDVRLIVTRGRTPVLSMTLDDGGTVDWPAGDAEGLLARLAIPMDGPVDMAARLSGRVIGVYTDGRVRHIAPVFVPLA